MYDVTKEDTFLNAKRWMEDLRAVADTDCVISLVGNQVDRAEMNPALRQVSTDAAKRFAE